MKTLQEITENVRTYLEDTKEYYQGIATGLLGGLAVGLLMQIGDYERGQTQATKNLVTAVKTMGAEFGREFNYLGKRAMFENDAQKCFVAGHNYLHDFERTFLENASEIAKGKIKIEDTNYFKCIKQDYDSKIGDISQF